MFFYLRRAYALGAFLFVVRKYGVLLRGPTTTMPRKRQNSSESGSEW